MPMFSKELIKHVADEEVYKFSRVWIADIARRLSRVSIGGTSANIHNEKIQRQLEGQAR